MRRGDPPGIVQRTPEGTRQTGHCTARICSVVSSLWFISVQESTGTTNRKYWVCCVYAPSLRDIARFWARMRVFWRRTT
jgi:hypothetical protein